ncbi:hypothetical protein BLNAU_4431 [Blattamonas nauphoetae]|uniref:Uncharacterized protein n=1 Tax=Blattamonas nauphoetae TaxID=2049346 RepID=A0ABQ9YA20_9EUKA|nr:hypothetical protein BLNAU_4431 [Blattamonas nauphoetae]
METGSENKARCDEESTNETEQSGGTETRQPEGEQSVLAKTELMRPAVEESVEEMGEARGREGQRMETEEADEDLKEPERAVPTFRSIAEVLGIVDPNFSFYPPIRIPPKRVKMLPVPNPIMSMEEFVSQITVIHHSPVVSDDSINPDPI